MKYPVRHIFEEEMQNSRKVLESVYKFENKNPAIFISDTAWWRFGNFVDEMPENYTNGNLEGMLKYQVDLFLRHHERNWND